MAKINTANFKLLEALIAKTGDTYVFNSETSVEGFGVLFEVIKDMGLNPMKTDELRCGMMSLFDVRVFNMPDFENNRFVFTPNHVSDLDAVILGLLLPKVKLVSKIDWANNEKLRLFLDIHYDLYGLDRTSLQSLRALLRDAVDYFNDSSENKHYLVFSQGTISDFNNNSVERISSVAQKISVRAGVPIVNMFIEQVSLYHPTRIVFDEPVLLTKKDDFRKIWLERERALQQSLSPPARFPKLSHKHANNNRPGDPFF